MLASYAKQINDRQLPATIDGWYAAVAQYGGATSAQLAQAFADDVFTTMQTGVSATTTDRQQLRIAATPNLSPDRGSLSKLNLAAPNMATANTRSGGNQYVDCPDTLNCRFIPAAYAPTNPSDPTQYGNYDPANRPHDIKIDYIIIHDTEGTYNSAISWFQNSLFANPPVYVSANYVIRSSDGAVTEMVHPGDVAWQAGDWYVNMHSIGIEHEGIAANGAAWYTEAMYRSSATLVSYLAAKYHIPLDREHILGHDNVPRLSPALVASQHWDPGPYWDWGHYMDLLHAPITSSAPVGRAKSTNTCINAQEAGCATHTHAFAPPHIAQPVQRVVTIAPDFATNQQPFVDCSTGTCVNLPAQGSNAVYLHTQPTNSSSLLSDPYLHPDNAPGTTHIEDWSATANSGDQFVVAGQQGNWTGVWYGGKVGWFYNPSGNGQTAHASHSKVLAPKAGRASIPVYGAPTPSLLHIRRPFPTTA